MQKTSPIAAVDGPEARSHGGPRDELAHDLKNILNSVALYLELIQRALKRGTSETALNHVDVMKQLLVRGAEAVDRLRVSGQRDPGEEVVEEEMDLNQLVREACATIEPLGSPVPRVRLELGSPATFSGCSSQIVSALVNLLVNALDAIAPGGVVTMRTGQSQDRIWVVVMDDGAGMPADVEGHAFEPFFTTKGGRGTGLGLAMVHNCMQRHRGSVSLQTAPGKGSIFTLTFLANRETTKSRSLEHWLPPSDGQGDARGP